MQFAKYHGTGNDFILIDDRDGKVNEKSLDIPRITDRHFGIGSDGLILIRDHDDLDFEMVFFNPDGSQSFCGNGSRCAVQFAMDLGVVGSHAEFLSTDGVHNAEKLSNGNIKLNMHDAPLPDSNQKDLIINTGSPHYVVFRALGGLDIIKDAREIRYNQPYEKGGINVNFVEIKGENEIDMRTYERGVEDETLSCGTGVTAAALTTHVYSNGQKGKHTYRVNTKGGQLEVEFELTDNGFKNVYLIGPAVSVFSGEIEL